MIKDEDYIQEDGLIAENEHLHKIVNEQDKEIERLNNIIKRFEEDLREVYLTFGEFSEEYTENCIKKLKGENNE